MTLHKNKEQQGRHYYPVQYQPEDAYTIDLYRSALKTMEPMECASIAVGSDSGERRNRFDRRESALCAFFYGNFRPRRRQHRRTADDHLILFDWYEPRVLYLALGVLLLSCTDALFTLNLLPIGATEGNIIMDAMLQRGMNEFLATKISLTAVSLVMLVAVVRRKFYRSLSVEHLLQVFFTGYLLVICYEIYLFKYVFKLNIF